MKDKIIEEIKVIGKENWAKKNKNSKEIEKLIKKYAKHYYEGKALITDDDFEILIDTLRIYDKDHFLLTTPGWGYSVKNGKEHKYGIVDTLKYFFDYTIIKQLFENENEIFILPKFDGINFVAYFQQGKLDYCCTRGNGKVGKDITKKFDKKEYVLSKELKSKDFAINGEIIYDKAETKDKSSFRDIVAKSINCSFFGKRQLKNIKFIPFGLLNVENDYNAQLEIIKKIYYEKLPILKFKKLPSKEELKEIFKKFSERYAIDGLVITNRTKTKQYAYKFKEIKL